MLSILQPPLLPITKVLSEQDSPIKHPDNRGGSHWGAPERASYLGTRSLPPWRGWPRRRRRTGRPGSAACGAGWPASPPQSCWSGTTLMQQNNTRSLKLRFLYMFPVFVTQCFHLDPFQLLLRSIKMSSSREYIHPQGRGAKKFSLITIKEPVSKKGGTLSKSIMNNQDVTELF